MSTPILLVLCPRIYLNANYVASSYLRKASRCTLRYFFHFLLSIFIHIPSLSVSDSIFIQIFILSSTSSDEPCSASILSWIGSFPLSNLRAILTRFLAGLSQFGKIFSDIFIKQIFMLVFQFVFLFFMVFLLSSQFSHYLSPFILFYDSSISIVYLNSFYNSYIQLKVNFPLKTYPLLFICHLNFYFYSSCFQMLTQFL